ncbi:MAG: 50S ribosomal protein L32e [Thermoplasmatales archaeon]|nr:MAG: 50S ribosomal protein L32e [Thermoplasmatales archaeon]
MAKGDVVKEFTLLKGVGKAKAELLHKNGFDSIEKLRNATVEDLVKVKGISVKNAKDILNQLKDKRKEEPKKRKEKAEIKVKETKKEVKEKKEDGEIVEESEEGHKAKKKPDLSEGLKEKLLVRKQIKKRTPEFVREEWFRYKRISKSWRRPDGISSKMRINLKYRPSKARVGFRGPKKVRGLHPSGFEEVMAYNVVDLERVDPKKQAVRIGSTVGTKKRLEIAKRAEELEIRILNMKV